MQISKDVKKDFLGNLNAFKSPHHDERHPKILKELAKELLGSVNYLENCKGTRGLEKSN